MEKRIFFCVAIAFLVAVAASILGGATETEEEPVREGITNFIRWVNRDEKTDRIRALNNFEESNRQRERVGLRLLKTNWCFYGTRFFADDWKETSVGPLCKRVQRDKSGAIIWEQDNYYSGVSYRNMSGQEWERVVVQYFYTNAMFQVFYVGTNSVMEKEFDQLALRKITIEDVTNVVDKALATWGQRRL